MRSELKKEYIQTIAQKIKSEGFRVFVSGSGEYGFFTDTNGERVVCFGVDDLSYEYRFSGTYHATKPSQGSIVGAGWGLNNTLSFHQMITARAPEWATRRVAVNYTTLEKHLQTYQQSSKYIELI